MASLIRDRRVLVTGGTGFLGSHTIRRLLDDGARVCALRRSVARSQLIASGDIEWLDADLLDPERLDHAVQQANPHIVIHLASYGARGDQRDSGLLTRINVGGTANLLKAIPPSIRFVMAGTCAEYGDVRGPAREDMACRPVSAYATAKHEAVSHALNNAKVTGRPVVILRPYGPFGPGDDLRRVLPAAIAGLLKGERVPATEGTQVRDFSYVDDHVEAIVRAATESIAPGSIFNIGTGRGVTVRDALTTVERIVQGPGRIDFGAKPMRADDVPVMVPDVSAARQLLGFEASVSFEDGVRRTIAALQEHPAQFTGGE